MAEVSAAAFKFNEQIQFLLGKTNVPTRAWTDVWRDGHDTGFMVAGAYKAELLGDLREAVNKAITEHRSLDEFRKDFDGIVQRHGWSYNGSRSWRTRVIFETNLRSSYQAGRYAQLTEPDFLKRNPYWRYVHSEHVLHPRPLHVSWSGKVVLASDPWWQSHYPPNGWGCKCTVYAENARSLARKGLTPGPAPDDGTEQRMVGARGDNPQTVTVPKGIDPGWDYAPGALRASQVRQQIEGRIAALPPKIGEQLQLDLGKLPPAPPAPIARPQSLPDYLSAGRQLLADLKAQGPVDAVSIRTALAEQRAVATEVKLPGRGEAAARIRAVSTWLPDDWTRASDKLGGLTATVSQRGRSGYQRLHDGGGKLLMSARAADDVYLHELVHRIQHALPGLDQLFIDLHRSRTAGDALRRLRDLQPWYGANEVTREDGYFNPYQGKEYRVGTDGKGWPAEVLTMSMQALLGGNREMLAALLDKDAEMAHLTLAALWYF